MTVEIVLVDGEAAGAPAEVADDRLRRVSGRRAGLGAARAAGLAAAGGPLVAYCDESDEWTDDHLRVLLDALDDHPEAALVYGDVAWRDDGHGPAALLDRLDLGAVSRIPASAVLHRAAAARDVGGFDPSLRHFADADLWLRMDEAHRLRHVPTVVATCERRPACGAQPGAVAEAARLRQLHQLARPWRDDAPRRAAMPFAPATWRPPRRELHWRSPLNPYQSFGLVGRQLLAAVNRAGIDVTLATPPRDDRELSRFAVSSDGGGRIGFSYDYWHRPDPLPAELLVVATMREGTLVPKARVNAINQTAALLYVPCRQNVESFRDSGVRVPTKVLPYGVDAARFPLLARPRTGRAPFTFGTFGALSPRKGTDVLVRAFCEEFAPAEPVRLLLKSVDALPFVPPDDPRIRVITGFWGHGELLALLRQMDAFVLPSRAEGFGLCGLEAMATGLPLIATNWSGPADYLDPADSLPLAYRLVDAAAMEANGVRYFGEWAEPEVDQLRIHLRWLFDHHAEAAALGKRASARVHRDWTWERVAAQLRDDLDLLANGLSPV